MKLFGSFVDFVFGATILIRLSSSVIIQGGNVHIIVCRGNVLGEMLTFCQLQLSCHIYIYIVYYFLFHILLVSFLFTYTRTHTNSHER